MTYLLKNGKIYDGTGADAFLGDILVRGDRIEKIGEGIICDGAQVIDLQGLSVSSGFMDAHSHNDWFAIRKDPRPFFEPFIRQGITSFITGNCGLSATGFTPDTPYLDKTGGVADRFSIPERGYVREGYFADLTVFNEDKLKAGEEDRRHSFGIEKVFINGQLILDGEALNTDAMRTSGRAMRAAKR